MSDARDESTTCASCGEAGGSLKRCCKSTYYCDVQCQRSHRKAHRKECEKKKATPKTADPQLGSTKTQGNDEDIIDLSPRDECPLCTHPLPLNPQHHTYMLCCGTTVCLACSLEQDRTAKHCACKRCGSNLPCKEPPICAFCRAPMPTDKDLPAAFEARIEKNDVRAMAALALRYMTGMDFPKDEMKAMELTRRAAGLGDPTCALQLTEFMKAGYIAQDRDEWERLMTQAAKGGLVDAMMALVSFEGQRGNHSSAMRYLRTAAACGSDTAVEGLKTAYQSGLVSKDALAKSLRRFQAAKDELDSDARRRHMDSFNKVERMNREMVVDGYEKTMMKEYGRIPKIGRQK